MSNYCHSMCGCRTIGCSAFVVWVTCSMSQFETFKVNADISTYETKHHQHSATFRLEDLSYIDEGEQDSSIRLYGNQVTITKKCPNAVSKPESPPSLPEPPLNWLLYSVRAHSEKNSVNLPKFLSFPPPVIFLSEQKPAAYTCTAQPAVFVDIICSDNSNEKRGIKVYPSVKSIMGNKKLTRAHVTSEEYNELTNNATNGINVPTGNIQTPLMNRKYYKKGGIKSKIAFITAHDVENWQSNYSCQCEAWNNMPELGEPRAVRNSKTIFKLAYIEKRFLLDPKPVNVQIGKLAELYCQPPVGQPKPQVTWLQNGLPITNDTDRIQVTEIVTFDGKGASELQNMSMQLMNSEHKTEKTTDSPIISRLSIQKTSFHDMGHYSCKAVNQAGNQVSKYAWLTVLVDGIWTEWSAWSPCPKECIPTAKRTVELTKTSLLIQSPSNHLLDLNEEKCPSNCIHRFTHRRRYCSNERAQRTSHCSGDPFEIVSCMDICQHSNSLLDISEEKRTTRSPGTKTGVIIMLIVVSVLLVMATFGVIVTFSLTNCPHFLNIFRCLLHVLDKKSTQRDPAKNGEQMMVFQSTRPNILVSFLEDDAEKGIKQTENVPGRLSVSV